MPFIENVEQLAESLADALGVWGCCPDGEKPSCAQARYCRVCWTMEITQRIREAVQREMQKAG